MSKKTKVLDEYGKKWDELKQEHIKLRRGTMTSAKQERLAQIEVESKELFERMWAS